MSQAFYLYQLQKIDMQLSQISKRLEELTLLINDDSKIKSAEAVSKKAREALDVSINQQKSIEDQIGSLNIKISTEESSLYGGKIANPKELQEIQNEISSLKKHLVTLENQLLGAMEEAENAHQIFKEATMHLDHVQARTIEEKANVMGEQAQLYKQKEKLASERDVAVKSVTPENLELYNRLKGSKHGVAVSLVEDLTCLACGVEIRASEHQEARSQSKLICCSSCGRILYSG